jgi:hypothetical protein
MHLSYGALVNDCFSFSCVRLVLYICLTMTRVSKGLLLSVTMLLDALEFLSDPFVMASGIVLGAYYAGLHVLSGCVSNGY